jgi:hypothetical protein
MKVKAIPTFYIHEKKKNKEPSTRIKWVSRLWDVFVFWYRGHLLLIVQVNTENHSIIMFYECKHPITDKCSPV